MDAISDEFWDLFFEEAEEQLQLFETAALQLEREPDSEEAVHRMFRAAHSLKGCSATLGVDDVATFTHALESLLMRMRDGQQASTPTIIDVLLHASDVLGQLLEGVRAQTPPPQGVDKLLFQLRAVTACDAEGAGTRTTSYRDTPPQTPGFRLRIVPDRTLLTHGADPLPLLEALVEAVPDATVGVETQHLEPPERLDPEACALVWTVTAPNTPPDELHRAAVEAFRFVDDLCRIERVTEPGASAEPRASLADAPSTDTTPARGRSSEATTLKVPTGRVDEIINLVGELVIAQGSLRAALPDDVDEKLAEAMTRMARSLRELQHCALSVRTLPLSTVFARFPRLVRDLAKELGKEVELQIEGGDTELDKSVIEGLTTPLTHIVRNAIDHGIETPESRLEQTKRRAGRLRLVARQSHGSVVLEIVDDGRGLDTQKILARGQSLGLLDAQEHPSVERIHDLVFEPGFSTANEVSEVSGRGVGMDAARDAIHALNGSIRLTSTPGEGTCTTITLPLSLAILDGFGVRVRGQPYVIPMASVVSVTRPRPEQIGRVFGTGEFLALRDRQLPLVWLGRALAPEGAYEPTETLAVVVEVSGESIALMVDEVDGQASVVIKALDESLRTNPALLGGTIDGEGRVTLILDLAGIVRIHRAGYGESHDPVLSAAGRTHG